ncbi:MAG TPA: exosortase-associated EpsI family protein [Tepidisphaeraceae bacterium]|jgi:hypothetical protein|nr:exosortase-associated EpsI family protein [Tepidisphaeraceae bacterium]
MASRNVIFASPVLCLGVLAVIAADNARHVKPRDAAPYHLRAKAAIDAFPYIIGYWTGSDQMVPEAAVKLLRPNALVSRRYENHTPGRAGRGPVWADLLISQCADSRDMIGHYPPICYPSSGEPQVDARPFRIDVGGLLVDGIEYQFAALPGRGIERKSVYNFFVVPGRGIVPDIGGVRRVSGDYQRRCFGAAQFQVVMDADQSPEIRDEVFATLIGCDTAVIKTLEDVR